MNTIGRVFHTSALALGGVACVSKAIHIIVQHAAKESPITLITTAVILFPLAYVTGVGTNKVFYDLGLKDREWRIILAGTVAGLGSTLLTSGASVGFKLTSSVLTAWSVLVITGNLILGGHFLFQVYENTLLGRENEIGFDFIQRII